MYRNMIVIMVVAIAFLGISINAVAADSTQLNVKPVSPASKIKAPASIAVPSPAPAPVVEPAKLVPDVSPKPKSSLTSTPKPNIKIPAPQKISPPPAPTKPPAISSLPKVKPKAPTASLPQGVQRNNLPAIQVPPDLGKSTRIPGSAGRDMTGNINIGSKLPDGHTSQPGGFSSRSPAAGLATGVSGRGGIGSVKDGLDNPVIKTGSGAQMQGQDSGEQTNQKPNEITFTKEEGEADYHISRANEAAEDAQFQIDFTAPEVEGEGEIDESDHTGTKSQPPPGFFDPSSERTVEGDPGDGNKKGNYANTDKVKDIFGGVRFAPDEEPTTGGTIDPELLQSIQSSKTQVNFVDGVDLNSNNFEDLSEQAQQAVKNRGQGNPVSN